jgi:hypothetical protein
MYEFGKFEVLKMCLTYVFLFLFLNRDIFIHQYYGSQILSFIFEKLTSLLGRERSRA